MPDGVSDEERDALGLPDGVGESEELELADAPTLNDCDRDSAPEAVAVAL